VNLRIPVTAAVAVMLASLSLNAVVQGNGWLFGGIGAVVVVTAAGLAARMSGLRFPVTASVLVLIAVVPLLFWPGWPALVAGLAMVALTTASVTGNRGLRGFAVVALYLAALLLYLNLAFAAGHSYGHVLPSHASLDYLGQLVRRAFTTFGGSPPVADTRAVSLVGSAGVGLVAVMVDVLAVRMRRPAIAGLPLLVLFSVPVASNLKTFGGLQVLTFAAGMAGYLTLLSTSGRERLRMWGQLVTFKYVQAPDEAGNGPDTKQLAASGRRVGLAAVCLAVIIPIVLPTMHAHDVFATKPGDSGSAVDGGSSSGNSSNASAQLDALLQVQQQLQEKKPRPVLTYFTTAVAPADQYLEVYVLNYSSRADNWLPQFTGGAATLRSSVDGKLPYGPQGQLPSTAVASVETTVTLNNDQSAAGQAGFLPVPYAPVKLSAGGSGWAELPSSLMVFTSAEALGGLRYTVTSSVPDPTPAQIENPSVGIPTSVVSEYGAYNGPDSARLAAIAHQHTLGASNELQEALDLQSWFTSSAFRYSLKPNLPAAHWLLTFLTTDRRGYCQQFAWAFAILARLVGIPSRVAIGYTGGSPGPHNTWQVTTADAHAWPELFFPGEGWLRFEPTPHGGTGQGTAIAPPYAAGSAVGLAPGGAGNQKGTTNIAGSGHAPGQPNLNRFTHALGGGGPLAPVRGSGRWVFAGIIALALLLIGWPAVSRRLIRRRRWLSASDDTAIATAAWRELTDDLADFGMRQQRGETPRAMARRIRREAGLEPAAAQALGRVITAAERAQYAKLAGPSFGLAEDVLAVRRALAASVPARRRIRAWLLPTSTLRAAQRVLQRAGDALSWLDTSLPALRRQLGGSQQHSIS
jgi:TgpA N-terminal domain/Transglutaminase-like superfamily